ncbi:MAG: holo-ACP synthase [Myxococcota bacterium]|nr:holo-ACP synthase [Myxococcota bacterium]
MIVGSGIDLIEVVRVERALERFGARFERRVFCPGEIEACRRHRRPAPHFAQRFAAKEALMKAVGTGWARGVRWVDIEVVGGPGTGRPASLRLHGEVAAIAARRGAVRAHLGMGRSRSLALASVLLEAAAA